MLYIVITYYNVNSCVQNFSWQPLPGSGSKPSSKLQVISHFSRGEMKTPAGPQLHYYYRIHEYWLIYKVFPAALTLLPGSELLVRIKNGCFLPFTTGDSRLGRPNTTITWLLKNGCQLRYFADLPLSMDAEARLLNPDPTALVHESTVHEPTFLGIQLHDHLSPLQR